MAVFKGEITYTSGRILNMVFTVLFAYSVVVLFLFFNQRSFIYYPGDALAAPAQAGAPEMHSIAVRPGDMDGAINGWYARPADGAKPVLLYFHGNGGGIDIRVPRIRALIDQGYGVLLAEYRGYGGNPGKPSEKGLYADADAYFKWLTVDEGIDENRIVLYGESLGSGVATYLAAKHWNIRGVILDAPFTSLTDLVQSRMWFVPVKFLLLDRYNSFSRIRAVQSPLLVLHGGRDTIVPVRYGKKLFAAANEPKTLKLFDDGNHSDLYDHGAGDAVSAFLAQRQP